jgi:hypothetical protein
MLILMMLSAYLFVWMCLWCGWIVKFSGFCFGGEFVGGSFGPFLTPYSGLGFG